MHLECYAFSCVSSLSFSDIEFAGYVNELGLTSAALPNWVVGPQKGPLIASASNIILSFEFFAKPWAISSHM